MDLNALALDTVVRGAGGGLRRRCEDHGIGFVPLGEIDFRLRHDTFLSLQGPNAIAAAQIEEAAARVSGQPVGFCIFKDVYVLAPNGLILDRDRRILWTGSLLGKKPQKIAERIGFLTEIQDRPQHFRIDDALFDAAESVPEMVLWGGTDFAVYGHMLLDYLPRLEVILKHFKAPPPIYNPPLDGWEEQLVRMNFQAAPVHQGSLPPIIKCSILHVPTLLRRDDITAESLLRPLWQNVGHRLAGAASLTAHRGQRLYVSRRKWHNKSFLANGDAVEHAVKQRGFDIIYPEELSFAEQYAAFAGASVIVGEDGSGLHNSIFSKPGTRIGIIWLGRSNPLHVMTANALGHHLLLIPAVEKPAGHGRGRKAASILPLDVLTAALDLL